MAGRSAGASENDTPFGQAKTLAALMDAAGHRAGDHRRPFVRRGRGDAHSRSPIPERTRGLVLLSAATHPWPGGATSWYYSLTAMPVVGPALRRDARLSGRPAAAAAGDGMRVFAEQGAGRLCRRRRDRAGAAASVRSAPMRSTSPGCIGTRRATAPRYQEIAAPTRHHLRRHGHGGRRADPLRSGLPATSRAPNWCWVRNLGHKPDWIAPELVVAGNRECGRRPQRPAGAGAEGRGADRRRPLTAPASAPRRAALKR